MIKTIFFASLRKYYYTDLEMLVHPGNQNLIAEKYFTGEPVKLENPAYQKAFRALFTDFLRKQSQDYKNSSIISLVNSANYTGLISFFEKKGYEREIAELVVLKGLYDGFYTGGFDKEAIQKAIRLAPLSGELKPVVKLISEKINKLSAKSKAPYLQLNNQKNEPVTLEKYKGKFIYLNFFKK